METVADIPGLVRTAGSGEIPLLFGYTERRASTWSEVSWKQ